MHDVLNTIIRERELLVSRNGAQYGKPIPTHRACPIAAFPAKAPFCIAEIKHGSPSQGMFKSLDVAATVAHYIFGGASCISVVTEPTHFFGDITDIMHIKTLFPGIPVLRKDFLTEPDDIDVSYRAGADAVLLIAALFMPLPDGLQRLRSLFAKVCAYNMTPVVEIHSIEELAFIESLHAPVIGINARNLDTMTIDRVHAVSLLPQVPPNTTVLFESGIRNYDDAFTAAASGFSGVLVGTSLLCSNDIPSHMQSIMQGLRNGAFHPTDFYPHIAARFLSAKFPFIKICGITNADDAKAALSYNVDCLGLILTESPRKITESDARAIRAATGKHALLIGVIRREDYPLGERLVKSGIIDALQIHGLTQDDDYSFIRVPWFEAVACDSPSVSDVFFRIYDAHTHERKADTPIDRRAVASIIAHERFPCIAGGITPETVDEFLHDHVAMIDVCSGVESSPGKKSHERMKSFMAKIHTQRFTTRKEQNHATS